MERANAAKEAKEPLSIGLLGNAANVFPSCFAGTEPVRSASTSSQRPDECP
ncbi:MAG: hypothetical protein R2693_02650 [Nocardioidaceae bacterium]